MEQQPDQYSIVLPYAMTVVQQLTSRNSIIIQMEERLESYVFDSSDIPWFIAFDSDPPDVADRIGNAAATASDAPPPRTKSKPFCPAIFNNQEFRTASRKFLARGRRLVRRFGFCAYWSLKPAALARWWSEYLRADATRRGYLGLPFDIIAPDEGIFTLETPKEKWFGPLKRVLRVRALNAEEDDYVYHIFDESADFIKTPESMWQASCAATVHPSQPRLHQEGMTGGLALSVVPKTVFYDLVDMLHQLQETRQNHLNAESQAAQTLIVVHTRPVNLKEASMQNTPETRLFDGSTVLEEKLNQVGEVKLYNLQQAKAMIDYLKNAAGAAGDQEETPQLVKMRRAQLGRPSPVEELVHLPEETQLAHVSRPTAIIRLDEMELNFRRAVASVLKLPFSMTEGSAASNGGLKDEAHFFNGARSIESVEEKQLSATVLRERAFYASFFEQVYANVFGPLDLKEMQQAHTAYEAMLDDMRYAKNVGKALARELAGAPTPDKAADLTARRNEVLEIAGSKEARKKVRVSIVRVRELIERMQTHGRGCASLIFEPGTTREAMHQLTGMMAVSELGVVSAKVLEPFVQAVFGAKVKLREPPAPSPTAAGGKTKKRKATGPLASGRSKKKQATGSDTGARKSRGTDETEEAKRRRRQHQGTAKSDKKAIPSVDEKKKKKKAADAGSDSE